MARKEKKVKADKFIADKFADVNQEAKKKRYREMGQAEARKKAKH